MIRTILLFTLRPGVTDGQIAQVAPVELGPRHDGSVPGTRRGGPQIFLSRRLVR
jgi:hypothetical protein